jgi:hypothetical protein
MKGDHVYLQLALGNDENEPITYRADVEEVINTSICLTGFSSK